MFRLCQHLINKYSKRKLRPVLIVRSDPTGTESWRILLSRIGSGQSLRGSGSPDPLVTPPPTQLRQLLQHVLRLLLGFKFGGEEEPLPQRQQDIYVPEQENPLIRLRAKGLVTITQQVYCMSKKSCPFLYSRLLCKLCQDFLDIQ